MTEIARIVVLDGPSNFRDLGGYRGHEGRSIKWRRLFRSDHLDGLSEADGDRLHALGITRVIDLRGEFERAASAVRIPGARYYALPIEPTLVQEVARILQSGCDLSASQAGLGNTSIAIVTFALPGESPWLRHFPHLPFTVQHGYSNLNEQVRPLSVQRICRFFAHRKLTTSLTADSAMLRVREEVLMKAH